MNQLKMINKNVTADIVIKKSKFIANIYYVQSEEEVNNILKKVKKNFWDAKHNCYAYRIINNGNIIEKSSDDGEPSRNSWKTYINNH